VAVNLFSAIWLVFCCLQSAKDCFCASLRPKWSSTLGSLQFAICNPQFGDPQSTIHNSEIHRNPEFTVHSPQSRVQKSTISSRQHPRVALLSRVGVSAHTIALRWWPLTSQQTTDNSQQPAGNRKSKNCKEINRAALLCAFGAKLAQSCRLKLQLAFFSPPNCCLQAILGRLQPAFLAGQSSLARVGPPHTVCGRLVPARTEQGGLLVFPFGPKRGGKKRPQTVFPQFKFVYLFPHFPARRPPAPPIGLSPDWPLLSSSHCRFAHCFVPASLGAPLTSAHPSLGSPAPVNWAT